MLAVGACFDSSNQPASYASGGRLPVILFEQVRGVDLVSWFPRVVTVRVSFPFDQVLECSRPSMASMIDDLFHFIFFFSVDKVRWRSGEVGPVRVRFAIGR